MSVGAPGLGAENEDEVENPPSTHLPPGSARPTHLHAGVEGPVHLGLDIHHLSNTGREKREVSLPKGTEGGSRGPRYMWGISCEELAGKCHSLQSIFTSGCY